MGLPFVKLLLIKHFSALSDKTLMVVKCASPWSDALQCKLILNVKDPFPLNVRRILRHQRYCNAAFRFFPLCISCHLFPRLFCECKGGWESCRGWEELLNSSLTHSSSPAMASKISQDICRKQHLLLLFLTFCWRTPFGKILDPPLVHTLIKVCGRYPEGKCPDGGLMHIISGRARQHLSSKRPKEKPDVWDKCLYLCDIKKIFTNHSQQSESELGSVSGNTHRNEVGSKKFLTHPVLSFIISYSDG